MKVLTEQPNLRINNLQSSPDLHQAVKLYVDLLMDYTAKTSRVQIVHVPGYCG
ncbi:MAG TPA: hypothetical protein VKE94_08345 [Gemmataceae bacterium]|nr:hypothetical protein [Gemmataceae bacterium]